MAVAAPPPIRRVHGCAQSAVDPPPSATDATAATVTPVIEEIQNIQRIQGRPW
jgi:hypothetical protein